MPFILRGLIWLVQVYGASLLMRILVGIGFSSATFLGLSTITDGIISYAQNQLQGLPSYAVQMLYLLKVDMAMNIVFSAGVLIVSMKLINGALTRFTFRPPTS